jgi:predicted CoA-binding protein
MPKLKEMVDEFLSLKRLAVAGVSGSSKKTGNYIYQKLKKSGYEVYAVNPNATEVEGDKCYPTLGSIEGKVQGVVIATTSKVTDKIVEECATLGIEYVWLHRSVDDSSYSEKAVQFCKDHGIKMIPAACPMMYLQPVDIAHKCMKWIFSFTGRIPKNLD